MIARYFVERCELPEIKAVHFVIYGPLGRGVSSSKLLDALGKGEKPGGNHSKILIRTLTIMKGLLNSFETSTFRFLRGF